MIHDYDEKLMLVFEEILRSGPEELKLSKQSLAAAFQKKFPGEREPTNRELATTFMTASDRGWIDILQIGNRKIQ